LSTDSIFQPLGVSAIISSNSGICEEAFRVYQNAVGVRDIAGV
jgi:hypothetical protein